MKFRKLQHYYQHVQNLIPGFLQHMAKTKYLHNIKSEHLLNQSQLGTDQSMPQHMAESNLLQKKTFYQLPHTIKPAQSTLENTTLYLAHSQTSIYALKMETKILCTDSQRPNYS